MSDHAIPLEIDAAPEDHKSTYEAMWRNARHALVLTGMCLLIVVYVFASSLTSVAIGVLVALGIFKFLGGRWISAIAWAAFGVVLFGFVALLKGWLS